MLIVLYRSMVAVLGEQRDKVCLTKLHITFSIQYLVKQRVRLGLLLQTMYQQAIKLDLYM